MQKSTLLIGSNGFVGHALTTAMTAINMPLYTLNKEDFSTERHSASSLSTLLESTNVVVYLASTSTPGSSAGHPLQELDGNLRPLLTLLEALQAKPHIHLIYISSGGAVLHRSYNKNDEYDAVYTKSYYGAGKLAAENFLEAYCQQFLGHVSVLRPSNLYGPGQYERPGFGIIPAALGKLYRQETLSIWGDGSAERDYLYIDDFINLLLAIISKPPKTGLHIYHASSETAISLNTLLEAIESLAGRSISRQYITNRKVDFTDVRLSTTRAQHDFGWSAKTPLRKGLEQTWQWFQSIQP